MDNSDQETREFEPAEVLEGSVDSVAEKFTYMSRADLVQLHELEASGKARTTLLAAIDQEIARRADAFPAASADTGGEGGPNPAWHEQALIYSQADLDAQLAERDSAHAAEIEKLKAEVAASVPKAGGKGKAGKPVVRAKDAEAPSLVALTGDTQIRFVDGDDIPLALAPMVFGPAHFQPNGAGAQLMRDIEFPRDAAEARVAGAWLIDDKGKAVGKAELVQPFAIGGGHAAKLLPGTLNFI